MHRNLVFHSDEHFDTFISDISFSTSKGGVPPYMEFT